MTKAQSFLSKLLRYPHPAVFDKDPVPGVAFRINHEGGLRWRILDEVMTVEIATGTYTFDLSEFSVGSLINRLKVRGVSVAQSSPYFFGRSARVLMDGQGDASVVGGDTILGFRSELWATYAAYASELRRAKSQVADAIKQMVITQAETEWLDVWGNLYGVPRLEGEGDPEHQQRIPQEAFRLRVNKYAIEKAIHDLTGLRVFIRETWPQMFRLDESRLSGTARLVSGEQWRYGYIQPVASGLFDWTGVLEIIERNKAAGVIVLPPLVEVLDYVDGELDGGISFGITAGYGAWVKQWNENRLDWMRLGETRPHRNWSVGIYDEWVITNTVRGGKWSTVGPGWPALPWNHGVRADDINGSILSGVTSEKTPIQLLYGTPEFRVEGAGITDEHKPVGVNFNTWVGGRTWRQDTWRTRGRPLPSSVTGLMETFVEDNGFLQVVNHLHVFVNYGLPTAVGYVTTNP